MRVHWFQHVPFEGLGAIEPWLAARGAQVSATRFFETPAALPRLAEVDLLIAMGGPMSVNDEDEFPWLAAEKAFLRDAIDAGKAVLGVCLGAQLIAAAGGAAVYPNREREIGWFPVTTTAAAGAGRRPSLPPEFVPFHWHGETFDLPPGAVLLGGNEACANQAFQLGERVIGLQFHLEMTPAGLRDIAHHCRAELSPPARYVQTADEIIRGGDQGCAAARPLLGELLRFITRE